MSEVTPSERTVRFHEVGEKFKKRSEEFGLDGGYLDAPAHFRMMSGVYQDLAKVSLELDEERFERSRLTDHVLGVVVGVTSDFDGSEEWRHDYWSAMKRYLTEDKAKARGTPKSE